MLKYGNDFQVENKTYAKNTYRKHIWKEFLLPLRCGPFDNTSNTMNTSGY